MRKFKVPGTLAWHVERAGGYNILVHEAQGGTSGWRQGGCTCHGSFTRGSDGKPWTPFDQTRPGYRPKVCTSTLPCKTLGSSPINDTFAYNHRLHI
jgi:hypothetical protein